MDALQREGSSRELELPWGIFRNIFKSVNPNRVSVGGGLYR